MILNLFFFNFRDQRFSISECQQLICTVYALTRKTSEDGLQKKMFISNPSMYSVHPSTTDKGCRAISKKEGSEVYLTFSSVNVSPVSPLTFAFHHLFSFSKGTKQEAILSTPYSFFGQFSCFHRHTCQKISSSLRPKFRSLSITYVLKTTLLETPTLGM